MTFWEHLLRVLPRKPLPALEALYWHLTRRRVRARNRLRVASADLSFTYELWIEDNEQNFGSNGAGLPQIGDWSRHPRFSVIVHSSIESNDEDAARSVRSVEHQLYANWELIETPDPVRAVEQASGDFVVFLRAGDALARAALFRFGEALQSEPDAVILYGDQDHIDGGGRRSRPWFKPRWNEELFLAQDYVSAASAIRTELAADIASNGISDLPSFFLEATFSAGLILHVPHITLHACKDMAEQNVRLVAVSRHLERQGASCREGPYDTIRVQWPLPEVLPLVSVIIPTKDKLGILRACVQSLLDQTDYPSFEVLIIDNDSVEKQTTDYLAEVSAISRVRVIRYGEPFNYSAINNFAVQRANGTYLCLLNNDTEIIQPDWLTELMRYATRSTIGAAGPMLIYDDNTIQHAGVVVGIGEAAGHAHRNLPIDQPGYFRMPHVTQYISAVTGACLVVEKAKFLAVGGLDEENLAVAFNDVDLCLKLEASGLRNVYVPHVKLIHHESKSRGNDLAPAQAERYHRELKVLQERWGTKTYLDPLHNPNLDRYSETFVIRV